jgi:hypothetical protein
VFKTLTHWYEELDSEFINSQLEQIVIGVHFECTMGPEKKSVNIFLSTDDRPENRLTQGFQGRYKACHRDSCNYTL